MVQLGNKVNKREHFVCLSLLIPLSNLLVARRALYSLIIQINENLTSSVYHPSVSKGCGLRERDRIKTSMTLLGYWRLLLFPDALSSR